MVECQMVETGLAMNSVQLWHMSTILCQYQIRDHYLARGWLFLMFVLVIMLLL